MKRVTLWGGIAGLAVAIYGAFELSPWPSALMYRALMNRQVEGVQARLARHVPAGVAAELDVVYAPGDPAARLDVFHPSSAPADAVLPTIVWVHGGGFIAGSKAHVARYLEILAARGYTAVGVDYGLAPGARYPAPLFEVNAALGFLVKNAGRLHVDASRLFLAGDSAGAQIAGQLAIATSSTAYAARVGLTPSISRAQLRGVILHSGLFDAGDLDLDGPMGGLFQAVGWSYLGVKDFRRDPRIEALSVIRNVVAGLPPMFVSSGNADLLASQSRRLAEAASKAGVAVDALLLPRGYTPPAPHEFELDLDSAAGREALERTLAFVEATLRGT